MRRIIVVAALFSTSLLFAQDQNQGQISYKAAPNAKERETLLLRDFHPHSMMHARVTPIHRAKFPVIDVHNHVNDAMGIDEHVPPEKVIQVMDAANVRTVVILTGQWGEKLQHVVNEMVKPHPGRFMVFTQIDYSKIDDPKAMVADLDDAVRRGARGLKVLKDLGLQDRDKSGKLIPVDDPRLDPVWEECGRLGIPVSIHVTDPEAFFHPIDGNNERYEELIEHPDWSFYDHGFPSKEEVMAQRDRMFAKHPHTTFIALHVANWPENLDYVSQLLDRLPNVMTEFGAREAELGRPAARPRIFSQISEPHHVRHRRPSQRGNVQQLLPLAGDRRRVLRLLRLSRAGALENLRHEAAGCGAGEGLSSQCRADFCPVQRFAWFFIRRCKMNTALLQRLKPHFFLFSSARLKPCPDRKPVWTVEGKSVRGSVVALAGLLLLMSACSKQGAQSAQEQGGPSPVSVTVTSGGPVVIRTTTAEFDVLPSGYVQASLLKESKKLTLDEPQGASDLVVSGGKEADFKLDFSQAKITGASGKLGRGRRVEIPASAASVPGLQSTFAIEVYDDFPNLALTTVQYKNAGTQPVVLDQAIAQRHRFNASLANASAAPYDLWSFQGSSYDWGKDDVIHIAQKFSQPNLMGAQLKNGLGGGIPVVAFWTQSVGEAIGHLETLPLILSLPVKVADDGRINTDLQVEPATTLQPGETYSTPRSFVAVYSGDFYEPLRLYSTALGREGWNLPKPSSEAYNVAWCGWGYEFNVTPKQMLGTIPKLKEMGIKWATLDDRWFDNYGDWEPRKDTFPGDSMKKMVADFHKQGIYAQLWWLPLGVEDGQGHYESHRYGVAQVVKEHPDWLILDKNGKHARMVRDLAVLDPSLPEVQAYYRQLTERFIRDWGFDGSKLDNIYTVPECYNPKHHHKSPAESVNAVGEVYKIIYETSRSLKPESVTQSCPCGTPPNLAWLPYMDQAVTADPVGSAQVRRRIKMYKALLGPEAAVYGDHVELTKINFAGANQESDLGRDFASTIGTGGVVGTKFVWPNPGPHFKDVNLTQDKEEWWKKWIGIYNQKMLSKGAFRNLYTIGYDTPEGYAIEKDGKMYYAFFATQNSKGYQGEVQLRGLGEGTYRVLDYVNDKDMGTVTTKNGSATLSADFPDHLLLEVSKQ